MLERRGSYPNLGSHVLKLICARLSEEWEAHYGHGFLLAETFVDPKRYCGNSVRGCRMADGRGICELFSPGWQIAFVLAKKAQDQR